MRRSCAIALFALASLTIWLVACGKPACLGIAASDHPDAPVITAFELADATTYDELAAQQGLGIDPWLIVIALSFTDPDGDLGQGELELYMNDDLAYRSDMAALLLQRGLPLNASAGKIPVVVRIVTDDEQAAFDMDLGALLVDGAGRYSNCQVLELSLSY